MLGCFHIMLVDLGSTNCNVWQSILHKVHNLSVVTSHHEALDRYYMWRLTGDVCEMKNLK